jgi:hypothetical protein
LTAFIFATLFWILCCFCNLFRKKERASHRVAARSLSPRKQPPRAAITSSQMVLAVNLLGALRSAHPHKRGLFKQVECKNCLLCVMISKAIKRGVLCFVYARTTGRARGCAILFKMSAISFSYKL